MKNRGFEHEALYHVLINHYGKLGDAANLIKIVKEAEAKGLKTDPKVASTLVQSYSRQGDYREAKKLHADIVSSSKPTRLKQINY